MRTSTDSRGCTRDLLLLHRILELDPRPHLAQHKLLIPDLLPLLPNHGIHPGLAEEGHAVPLRSVAPHTMERGHEFAPAHLRHEVPDIDDEAPRHIRGGNPVPVGVANLQSARAVLVQERKQTRVGVGRAAELLIRMAPLLLAPLCRRGGVVQETQRRHAVPQDRRKGSRVLSQGGGKQRQEGVGEGGELGVERLEPVAGGEIGGEDVGLGEVEGGVGWPGGGGDAVGGAELEAGFEVLRVGAGLGGEVSTYRCSFSI